ncbi:uncharacterized protein [Spinacia oleracea]|uniref:VTT domain-containing protein n=1 Tax=Spinacia oleracea TaxID=3562 RepID=A0ABM3R436_SPIOL|nr:uncharacterized protein LOC110805080 [Spinacia oleracea]
MVDGDRSKGTKVHFRIMYDGGNCPRDLPLPFDCVDDAQIVTFNDNMDTRNLANVGGLSLRARSSLKPEITHDGEDLHRATRPWFLLRRWFFSSVAFFSPNSLSSALRRLAFVLIFIGFLSLLYSLPIEQYLKDFLLWVKEDLGPWGPVVLAIAYIPLTVLAVPASVLTLGGGYLFGLPLGFIADSTGATIGATAAFLLGRTIGKSYVISKLKNYPKFQAVAIAIQKSGFKIVLLLRLVPLLPFNMLNYLLSVTPVNLGAYILATWLGMMPITFAFVYVGTTLKDLSDVTHGWNEVSTARLGFIGLGLIVSVVLIMSITRIAKASLDKALAENADVECILASDEASKLPTVKESPSDFWQPLVIKIDPS